MRGLRELLGLPEDRREALTPQVQMGIALANSGKPTYSGTVPYAEVRRRRAANRRSKVSRRANRSSR